MPHETHDPRRVLVVSRFTQQRPMEDRAKSWIEGEPTPIVSGPRGLAGEGSVSSDAAGLPRTGRLPPSVRAVLNRLAVGDEVAPGDLADAFRAACGLSTPTRDVVLGSLLTAVVVRGPRVDEVEALLRSALTMDDRASPVTVAGAARPVLLLAGSGKKGLPTLNVSTPAALVAAAVGARVVKVGSAATSSALGSRDLVRALGLREHRTAAGVQADLDSCGFAFVAVEPEIPVLDRLYGGRFHAPTPFSFGLAPLASPVRGEVTVFGLAHPRVDVAAEVLRRFDFAEADVLSTRLPAGSYLDEVGTDGDLRCCQVRAGLVGPVEVKAIKYRSAALGLPASCSPTEAVDRAAELLTGGGLDDHRALVAINSAYLLLRGGVARSLSEGRELAEDALRTGSILTNMTDRYRDPAEHRFERGTMGAPREGGTA